MRPLYRALFIASSLSRPVSGRLRALLVCLVLSLIGSAALAQTPPAYPGTATTFPASYGHADSNTEAKGSWDVGGPGVSGTPSGWNVTCTGSTTSTHQMTITVPPGLPTSSYGSYTASYVTGYVGSVDSGYNVGYTCNFQVVAAPPTLPVSGNPAFSWQGSVAGVNTGNGNKTTVLPITGWTMRGGMKVSCALIHNSQITPPVSVYGSKWLPSYFTYLSNIGGNPTIHWDNGLSYTFTKSGTAYTPPYGILDKLAYTNSIFTLTTTDNTVYTFGYVNGNAYLSSITDMDGNTLTIGHNSDTTISAVTDPTGRKLIYTYSGGKLYSVTDPLSRIYALFYTGSDLTQLNTPILNGQYYAAAQMGYDGNHNLTSLKNTRGYASTFGYDTSSPPRLLWAKDPLGNQTTFTYNPNNTVITDPNGHTTTHTYAFSRLASVTDALGYSSGTAYDYNNIVTSTTDKRGYVWNYSSHFSNGTTTSSSTDPLNYSSSSTYDAKNKVVSTVDAMSNTTANTYSTDGKEDLLTSSVAGTGTAPFHATSSVGGYSYGLPTTFTDALSYSSSVGYDTYGAVNKATDANSNTSTAVSNVLGWKTSSTDANNHTTISTYDNWGRVTAITAPDNTQTTTTYDLDGNILQVMDANAAPATLTGTTWTAGKSGAALSFNGSAVATVNATLGNFGVGDFSLALWVNTTSPSSPDQLLIGKRGVTGNSSFFNVFLRNGTACFELDQDTAGTDHYELDGTRRVNDGAWHHIVFVRVGARLTTYIDGTQDVTGSGPGVASLSNTAALTLGYMPIYTSTHYVGAMDETRIYNRALSAAEVTSLAQNAPLASTANGLQSFWHFDEGSGVTASDACHSVTNVYDADDRLLQTTNGRGDVVRYTYDGTDPVNSNVAQKGLLSSKTDGNNHTTYYSYTARNEPSATYYPDGTSESVTYDQNGNTLTRTKADGSVIRYTYDADNRLTDITYPHMTATHFGYDGDGRRILMTDATGTTRWDYTYEGVHLNETITPQGSVGYAYDADGRRSIMDLVGTGNWYYTYDNAGRLAKLQSPTDGTTMYAYDAADRVTKKTLGNGNYELYAYDTCDEVTGIGYWWADGTEQNALTYSYDPAGNVLVYNQGFYNTTYGYDGADQLVSETSGGPYPPPALGFTYDHNGNRLTQASNGSQSQSFTYDAHDKMLSGINETDGWDLNGNETSVTLSGSLYQMRWDDEDRLVGETTPSGVVDTFTYNGLGLRVGKTDSTGTYSYICDGTTPNAPVLSDGHALYTPGLSENRGGVIGYYFNDRLGNLWTIDGSSKSQLTYEDFSGFGQAVAGGTSSPFGFGGGNGSQTDTDIAFVQMGHRFYDSRQGRFISQDPAGAGDNWYAYAGNNPVNKTDPSGLDVPFGDFGLGAGQRYAADPITSAQAGMNAQLNQSAGLIAQFRYFEVDRVFYQGGHEIGRIELFEYAVPVGTSIYGNLAAARSFETGNNNAPWIVGKVRDAAYVRHHFANKTVGDFKDKSFPGIGQPRPGTRLYELADNGGNMNGGMGMEGLDMSSWEIATSGDAHIAWQSKGSVLHDDPMGAAVLQVGYNYAAQLP